MIAKRNLLPPFFSLLFAGLTPITPLPAADPAPPPPNVIFDTDMWGDVDDVFVLAMLHALHDRHEINLAAITISTEDNWCASYIDLINTFYSHGQIPIGIARDGLDNRKLSLSFPFLEKWLSSNYTQAVSELKHPDGSPVYPHRLRDGAQAPEAVSLLRKTLSAQPDGSVVMIQVGFCNNLARLLDSPADQASELNGLDLVRRKVRLLSVMAGDFGAHMKRPEYNLIGDIPAAKKLFAEWPTPIAASGFEIGLAMLYPAASIEQDYAYVARHPIAESYRLFSEEREYAWPHDHPTFDLTSVLYAARPDRGYFDLSKPGNITVLDNGGATFEESETGSHRHLVLNEAQKVRALEAMVMLASQPPVRRHE